MTDFLQIQREEIREKKLAANNLRKLVTELCFVGILDDFCPFAIPTKLLSFHSLYVCVALHY